MAAKVGALIKEARLAADLTQEKLAKKVGVTAADISKAERGEADLTTAVLKKIAVATGVTQALLLNAAKGTAKTSAKSTAKTSAKKETKPKTPDSAGITMRVTATEKRLVEAYRGADGDTKKAALRLLKGESEDVLSSVLGTASEKASDTVADLLGGVVSSLLGGK